MKYFLWIDGKQDGPYEAEQIREMLSEGRVTAATLCHQEDGTGEWSPISSFREIIEPPRSPEPTPQPPTTPTPTPTTKPEFSLPPIVSSGVGFALTIFATLEFFGAVFGGIAAGADNPGLGLLIFAGGVLSGLICLGFAAVIENTRESSQRLRRIEMLIQKAYDDKTRPDSAVPKN